VKDCVSEGIGKLRWLVTAETPEVREKLKNPASAVAWALGFQKAGKRGKTGRGTAFTRFHDEALSLALDVRQQLRHNAKSKLKPTEADAIKAVAHHHGCSESTVGRAWQQHKFAVLRSLPTKSATF
jgi:hypothetical protein